MGTIALTLWMMLNLSLTNGSHVDFHICSYSGGIVGTVTVTNERHIGFRDICCYLGGIVGTVAMKSNCEIGHRKKVTE